MNLASWFTSWLVAAVAVACLYFVLYAGLVLAYSVFSRTGMSRAKEALRGSGNWSELVMFSCAIFCIAMAFSPIIAPVALCFALSKLIREHDWTWAEKLRMLSWQ